MDTDRYHPPTTLLPAESQDRRAELTLWVLVLGTALAVAIATLILEW